MGPDMFQYGRSRNARLAFGERGQFIRQPTETFIALDDRWTAEFRRRREFFQLFQIGHGVRH